MVDIELPRPRDHEVVVQIAATGVCHSQLHNMHAPNRVAPTALGHEAAGVVVEVGALVDHTYVGDHVLLTWIPRVDPARRASPPVLDVPGYGRVPVRDVFTWATHTVIDELLVVPIDHDIDLGVAAVVGCAVMTGTGAVLHSARVPAGATVAVIGAGGVGLCAIAAAHLSDPSRVIAIDLGADKLEMARRYGATDVIDASLVDAVAAVRELTPNDGFDAVGGAVAGADFVFDCVGAPATTTSAIEMARNAQFGRRPGGTAVIVGVPQAPLELHTATLLVTEKHIIGSLGGSSVPERDVPRLLDWYRAGRLDLDGLVSARYGIDDINQATEDLAAGRIRGRAIIDFA